MHKKDDYDEVIKRLSKEFEDLIKERPDEEKTRVFNQPRHKTD